jgi:hypothetical protein
VRTPFARQLRNAPFFDIDRRAAIVGKTGSALADGNSGNLWPST